MKASFAAVALAAVSGAAAASNGTDVYVTEVVTAFTTYCPEATVLTIGSQTHTITEATTLTVTDCPCTVTKPASSVVAPVATSAPYSYTNGTAAATSAAGTAASSGSATGSAKPSSFTGAATVNQAGMGLAAIMGLAAFAL